MQKCVEFEIRNYRGDFFKILEVGSWAGASALLWATALKEFGGGCRGLVLCVDPWKPYIGPESVGSLKPQKYERIERALKKGKIYKLFLHNIKAAGYADIIKSLRGSSDEILPTLQDGEFNFVYIDGSHVYSQVIRDLGNGARLVSVGGILCGDDLELQQSQIDFHYAEKNKGKDYILDVGVNKPFHPGVTLAVWEFFGGEVSSWDGFWAMRKTESGWQKIILDL